MAETSTQRTLDLVQALAVIVTGAWVLFRYFDHERDMAGVQVQQQQLLNQQAVLTLRITQDQKNLRMAELKNAVDLQSQDLELRKLQQAKAQQELSNAQKYRFLPDATVATRMIRSRGKLREYEVDLFFGITNKSEGPVDVSASVVDYYLGVPKTKHADRVMVVEPMGQPTDRWNPKGGLPGAIQWKQVGYAASMAAKTPDKMLPIAEKRLRVLKVITGGPGTLFPADRWLRMKTPSL